MESIVMNSDEMLSESLKFKVSKTASYVISRKFSSFHPSTGATYSSAGAKLIRISLNGSSEWVDPATVRLQFRVNNRADNAAKVLRTISGPWAFIKRVRVLMNNTLVEDLTDYNRIHEMLHVLQSEDKRKNDMVECGQEHLDFVEGTLTPGNTDQGFEGGTSRVYSMRLMSGVLNQPRYLPLRWMPLTFEIELVNNADDPVISVTSVQAMTGQTLETATANTSVEWDITEVQIKSDLVRLDSQLEEEYNDKIDRQGLSFPLEFNTFVQQLSSIPNGVKDVSVNVARALTRCKAVFVTYDNANNGKRAAMRKSWNNFYHPNAYAAKYENAKELEWHLSVGPKVYPDYPITSLQESWQKMKRAVYGSESNFHSVSISADQYRQSHHVSAIDLERMNELSYSGENTKSGELMTLRLKPRVSLGDNEMPSYVYMVLHFNAIAEVRSSGVLLLD